MAYSKNSIKGKVNKKAKNFAKAHPVLAIILVIVFIAVIVGGYYAYNKYFKDKLHTDKSDNGNYEISNSLTGLTAVDGELSFHFLMLGNKYSGDAIFVKAGENDILIDGGSRENSSDDIINYVNNYCTDGVLEYVIVTHADRDHIACFADDDGIFNEYKCKTIIDFPLTNKNTETYKDYIENRNNEKVTDGAVIYNALECYNNENGAKRIYDLGYSIEMEILYNYYYEHNDDDENNYSVCVMFRHGDRQFLFTGDLEKEGEEKLAEKYDFSQVELYKAGHHGSKTSSNDCLLKEIKPKLCVVSCNTGNEEFTDVQKNTFPTQDFIDRISKYTDKVYVTTLADSDFVGDKDYLPMNGNIIVSSASDSVTVSCSNNGTLLKDTAWFTAERIMPDWWLD